MNPTTAPSSIQSPTAPTDVVKALRLPVALGRIARCAATTAVLIARGRLHRPHGNVGRRLAFADGTSAPVYRETVVDRPPLGQPVVLVVEFRMRFLNGRRGQAYFRLVSLLNTPLFAGFPGFATKLWMAADEEGKCRGLYEWDDARPRRGLRPGAVVATGRRQPARLDPLPRAARTPARRRPRRRARIRGT